MIVTNPADSVFIPLETIQPNKDLLRTYVAIVLDKSGSMDNIRDATIQGFNSQVDSIVKEAIGQVFLSLVTFSTNVEPVFFNKPPSYLTKLSRGNYKPQGYTALYDAVGHTIQRLDYTAEDVGNAAFLVIVVSDGQENHSQQYRHTLPGIIKAKQATGRWTFVYVGSNHDIAQASSALWIPAANTYRFTNDWQGTAAAFNATSQSLGSYFAERSAGLTSSSSFYKSTGNTEPAKLNVTIKDATTTTVVNNTVVVPTNTAGQTP
jgi:hypothetical protein